MVFASLQQETRGLHGLEQRLVLFVNVSLLVPLLIFKPRRDASFTQVSSAFIFLYYNKCIVSKSHLIVHFNR